MPIVLEYPAVVVAVVGEASELALVAADWADDLLPSFHPFSGLPVGFASSAFFVVVVEGLVAG